MKTLVIGYDHHFGRNREGSYKELEEMASIYGFRLEEISKQVIDEVAVSSTKTAKHCRLVMRSSEQITRT